MHIFGMDVNIFYFINSSLSNPVFDYIMPIFSYAGQTGIIWIILSFLLIFFGKKPAKRIGTLCLVGLILSGISTEVVLKNVIRRERPYNVLENVNLLVPKEKSFSFPSGHATSSFTASSILGLLGRKYFLFFIFLATFISFSRIYCGVHYPSDVLSGCILGIILGNVVIFLYRKIHGLKD